MLLDFRLEAARLRFGTTVVRTLPPRSNSPITAVLSFPARASDPALTFADVHVAGLAADERFVRFDFAAAELSTREVILHGLADAVKHEPCRLLSDADSTGNL